jgi:hypothetical protein
MPPILSLEDGNGSSFRKVVFLEYQTMDNVQKISNPAYEQHVCLSTYILEGTINIRYVNLLLSLELPL